MGVFVRAFRDLQSGDPEDPVFQEAVGFLLDDESAWHRLLQLDRHVLEAVLTRIHEGEPLRIHELSSRLYLPQSGERTG